MAEQLNLISLEKACWEIKQGVGETGASSGRSPFFFIVGAGISAPSVPLAGQIVVQLSDYLVSENQAVPSSADPMERYSRVFGAAHPHRASRQQYFQRLLANKPITRANLRLAHLLSSGKVTNLVVTPNFDSFLSHSLQALGVAPVICDHPRTVVRLSHERESVAVVHVHGTTAFYDCCNLEGELVGRAAPHPNEYTMARFLDETLHHRSPIVVGYSGWERDAIMSALKRRLDVSELGTRLYWFCHKRSDVESLPPWLTNRAQSGQDDVWFVVPEPLRSNVVDDNTRPVVPRDQEESTLDAAVVFEQLAQQFRLSQPLLFSDPLEFLAQNLRGFMLDEVGGDTSYFTSAVIQRVLRAKQLEEQEAQDPSRQQLRAVQTAVRESRYVAAAENTIAMGTRITELTDRELEELLIAAELAVKGRDESASLAQGRILHDWIVFVGRALLTKQPENLGARMALPNALVGKGIALGGMSDHQAALRCFEEAEQLARAATGNDFDKIWSDAALNLAIALGALGRHKDAAKAFQVVLDNDRSDVTSRSSAALNKGIALWRDEDAEGAVDAYEAVLSSVGDGATELDTLLRVHAKFNMGVALSHLKRTVEAMAVYESLETEYWHATDVAVLRHVAGAMVNRGVLLATHNRAEESVEVFRRVFRFSSAESFELRLQVALAYDNAIAALRDLARFDAAGGLRRDMVALFAGAREPQLRLRAANALIAAGDHLRAASDFQQALSVYEESLARFAADTDQTVWVAVARALHGRGVCLLFMDRDDEAAVAFKELERRFGHEQRSELRVWVADAQLGLASALAAKRNYKDALEVFERARTMLVGVSDLDVTKQLVGALVGKGTTLEFVDRADEGLSLLNDVVSRFGDSSDADIEAKVAFALQRKTGLLANRGRDDEAIAAADEFLRRFANRSEPALVTLLAQVLAQKGAVLYRMGRYDDAIGVLTKVPPLEQGSTPKDLSTAVTRAMYLHACALESKGELDEEDVVLGKLSDRVGATTDAEQLMCIGTAMLKRGLKQGSTNPTQSLATYEELAQRFLTHSDAQLRTIAISALNDGGFLLLRRAKCDRGANVPGADTALLGKAREWFERALVAAPEHPVVLGNLGYVAFLAGDKVMAANHLARAIELGGEKQRELEIADAAMCPLPEDVEFAALVASIPAPNQTPHG